MKKENFVLFIILFLAIFFRFNNLNWDSGHHLHPDERFLTMVGNAMKIPSSFSDYLNPKTSQLNPNNIGFNFFVYGVFPISLNKILAVIAGNDDYSMFTIQGRFLSALADLFVVILVYKSAKLLFPKQNKIPLFAAFFYAIAVLPIQLSHFFAVDTFLNLFMFASFYFILKFYVSRFTFHVSLFFSAVIFGLALASKVTAIFILPLILAIIIMCTKKNVLKFLFLTSCFLLLAYFTLRLADPHMFENANFFDPRPSKIFLANLQELKNMTRKDPGNYFPPMIQWMNKNTIIHSIVNNSVFGLGIPIFIFVIIGILATIKPRQMWLEQFSNLTIILIWATGFFTYQSLQVAPTIRYFIFLYPFFAIFAGIGVKSVISYLLNVIRSKNKNVTCYMLHVIFGVVLLIWPVMFSSIYFNKHSRIAASEWIYQNFANGAVIANEHWDDGLPLPMPNNNGKQFTTLELPVFGPDDQAKWTQMDDILEKADYYILSSNRGWGSIPTVPKMYPKMSKFYKDLFDPSCHPEPIRQAQGELREGSPCFKQVAEFTSYPRLNFQISNFKFQISFPDDWADETFTVYDHPKVMIFHKQSS